MSVLFIRCLEQNFQREDNLPVVVEAGCNTRDKIAIGVCEGVCANADRLHVQIEIGTIKKVVELGAELQLHLLPKSRKGFENGGVLIKETWLAEGIAGKSSIKWAINGDLAAERRGICNALAADRIVNLV